MKNATARKLARLDTQTVQSMLDSREEFALLVTLASQGDRRAVGAIVAALGPDLLKVARKALDGCEDEAADVLQDFALAMLEQRWPFTRAQGDGMAWMCGVVRMIARNRRREARRQAGVGEDGW